MLAAGFAQVLELAARCGVLQVGGITVAIDGTKVLANASKHAAVSYERAGEQMRELDLEIEQLLRGFRRFFLRGLAKAKTEWTLVTLAYNLKRLLHMKVQLQTA